MDYWQILQLTPTADIRAIKKAYAVLLKQNRPDENPAGFQQLHAAYQDALRWAEDYLDAEMAQPQAVPAEGGDNASTDATLADETAADTDTGYGCGDPDCEHCAADAAWEKYLDEQWETLVQQVEDTLEDPQRRNDPAAWQFLVESEALLDIDFKSAFALRFLQRLLQMFSQQQESGETLLQADTVTHLNQLFWWSERRHHYDDYIDPLWMDDFMLWWQGPPAAAVSLQQPQVLTPLQVEQPQPLPAAPVIPYAHPARRLLAMLIDGTLLHMLGIGIGMIVMLVEPTFPLHLSVLLTVVLGYPFLGALFEMSPLQGSPGKYGCRIKVCDQHDQRIGPIRALLRALLFMFSMYFIYITIIINLLIWDGRLLHDRFSGTRVLAR